MPVDSGRRQLWINDREISDIAVANGFRADLEAFTNARGGVADSMATSPIPSAYGEVITAFAPSAPKGAMSFRVRVMTTTLAALEPAVQKLVRVLLTGGYVRVRTDVSPYECYARLVPPFVTEEEEYYNGNAVLVLNFELDDPFFLERAIRRLILPNGVRVQLPMGTGPMHWDLRIRGPFTNAVATYRNHRGDILAQIKIPFTVGATEWFDVGSRFKTVYHVTAGTSSTLSAGLGYLDTVSKFPRLSPVDAFQELMWATIDITDDANTASGHIAYRKRYR